MKEGDLSGKIFALPNMKVGGRWNEAFMAKILWDIQRKKDSLWIHYQYLKRRDIWHWKVHKHGQNIREWLKFEGASATVHEALVKLASSNQGPKHLHKGQKIALEATVYFL